MHYECKMNICAATKAIYSNVLYSTFNKKPAEAGLGFISNHSRRRTMPSSFSDAAIHSISLTLHLTLVTCGKSLK